MGLSARGQELLKKYRGQRVAVTGAGGFVGSHLCRLLVEQGAQLTALDLREPSPRLDDLRGHFDFAAMDLRDAEQTRRALIEARPQLAFHLAAYAVQARDRDAQMAISINVAGSVAVVEGAARAGAEQIVQIGTSHEYGGSDRPIAEDHPLKPTGIYGASKAAGMILGRARAKELGIRWLGLRPFVTFGPGEDLGKLVPYVIRQSLKGEPALLSSGEQVRDFVYVEELVQGMALAAVSDIAAGEIVNLGSGQGRSLKDFLTELVQSLPGADLRFGARPDRPDDMAVQVADVSRRLRVLGEWGPDGQQMQGAFDQTARFYREQAK